MPTRLLAVTENADEGVTDHADQLTLLALVRRHDGAVVVAVAARRPGYTARPGANAVTIHRCRVVPSVRRAGCRARFRFSALTRLRCEIAGILLTLNLSANSECDLRLAEAETTHQSKIASHGGGSNTEQASESIITGWSADTPAEGWGVHCRLITTPWGPGYQPCVARRDLVQ